jgi:hypothetical protein
MMQRWIWMAEMDVDDMDHFTKHVISDSEKPYLIIQAD